MKQATRRKAKIKTKAKAKAKSNAMIRTQVSFPADQYEHLKAFAAERGASIAWLVRKGVAQVLADEDRRERMRRLLAAAGSIKDPDPEGATDVAVNHDKYLAEYYAQSHGIR